MRRRWLALGLLLLGALMLFFAPATEAHHRCGHQGVVCPPPPPPPDSRLTPLTLYAPIAVADTSVELDWSSDPTGTRTGYRVYFRPGLAGAAESSQGFDTSAGTVTGLTPSTAYSFNAVALFSDGAQTERSNTVTATTTGVPPPPPPPPCPTFDWAPWGGTLQPDACWRPFAATSPWNVPVPAAPRLRSNSAAIMARLFAFDGDADKAPANVVIDADPLYRPPTGNDYAHPTYFAKSTDPLYTFHCYKYTCSTLEGKQARAPSNARAADGGDGAMNVIQPNGDSVDVYEGYRSGISGSTWNVGSGALTRIDGTGLCCAAGDGGPNAAHYAGAAGETRPEERIANVTQHVTFGAVKCVNGHVWPATHDARQCSVVGESMTDAPALGDRIWLDMTDAEIAALPVKDSWRYLLRGLAHYGSLLGDTGGAYALTGFGSSEPYHSVGEQNPLVAVAQAEGWSPYTYNGEAQYVLSGGSVPDSVWARLRVLDPCVTAGTC